ncbi:MAG: M20/M25/M40 family metallo-hydrolase [Spirochaetales bacterium]|nr:M20/M25/M40 family metallo-hydrolase [Spirochaetales bacterium]
MISPVALLRRLVRADTSNPPGDERSAAAILLPLLREAGLSVEELSAAPGRVNLIASLDGGSEPPLILISHLDVVPATETEWRYDPFGAEMRDGFVYGRGTLDTKQLTVMETAALLRLAAGGVRPKRPVVLIAAADEEAGSRYGMEWLRRERPELFTRPGTVVLSEGGGFPIRYGEHRLYPITCGEKGRALVVLRVDGPGGHASNPPPDHVLVKIARVVARLSEIDREPCTHSVLDAFDRAVSEVARGASNGYGTDDARDRDLLDTLRSYAGHLSAAVRRLEAGVRINVIPSRGTLEIELRLPPGASVEDAMEQIVPEADDGTVQWSVEAYEPGFLSPHGGEFLEIVEGTLRARRPEARLLPVVALGRTDGRFFDTDTCAVYGFSPLLDDGAFPDVLDMVHRPNERVSAASIEWGTDVISEIVDRYAGGRHA